MHDLCGIKILWDNQYFYLFLFLFHIPHIFVCVAGNLFTRVHCFQEESQQLYSALWLFSVVDSFVQKLQDWQLVLLWPKFDLTHTCLFYCCQSLTSHTPVLLLPKFDLTHTCLISVAEVLPCICLLNDTWAHTCRSLFSLCSGSLLCNGLWAPVWRNSTMYIIIITSSKCQHDTFFTGNVIHFWILKEVSNSKWVENEVWLRTVQQYQHCMPSTLHTPYSKKKKESRM